MDLKLFDSVKHRSTVGNLIVIKPYRAKCGGCKYSKSRAKTKAGIARATKQCWEVCNEEIKNNTYVDYILSREISFHGMVLSKRGTKLNTPIRAILVRG